jgi:diguanylate cyclase (GGDEF)-like protein/PAS domain S-box-containing protein
MMQPIKIIFLFIIVQLLAASSLEGKESERIVLQLKWEHQFQFAGYYAAAAQGYYRDAGLDVEIRAKAPGSKTNVAEEVLSGRVQYGVGSSSLLRDIANGDEIMILAAVFEHSPLVLICREEAQIRSPHQLNKKKIMLGTNEEYSIPLYALLRREEISYKRLPYNFKAFEEGEADALSAYLGNQPFSLDRKKIGYTVLDPASYGLDFYSDFLFTSKREFDEHPERVSAFTRASMRGWQYALSHVDEVAELIHIAYAPHKSIEALEYEAKVIRNYSIPRPERVGKIDLDKLSRMMAIYRQTGLISEQPDLAPFLHPWLKQKLKLSDEETAWLERHPVITYSETEWEPIAMVGDDDMLEGMAVDYLRLIGEKSGIDFRYLPESDRDALLFGIRDKTLDVALAKEKTASGEEYALFSKPYRSCPMVVATQNSVDYLRGVNSLYGKRVALTKGGAAHAYLQNNFPEITLVPVANIGEALKLLSRGEVFAVVGSLPVISYGIRKRSHANVKISGALPYQYDLRLMVRDDYPELVAILNKAIDSFTDEERRAVTNRWLALKIEGRYDYRIVLLVIIASLLLLLLMYYWVYRLRSEIAGRKKAELELQRMMKVINENVLLSKIDRDGRIICVSDAFCDLYGCNKDEMVGQNYTLFKDNEKSEEYYQNMWRTIRSKMVWKGEIVNTNKQGKRYWVESTITPILDEKGRIQSFMEIRKNITNQKRIEELATTDPLTKLYNRRYFNTIFDQEIRRMKRERKSLTFMMLDLDQFKQYNDIYGHLSGDEVLINTAKKLKEICQRSTDQIFRLGGEEFGILIAAMPSKQVKEFAQTIIESIASLEIPHEGNPPYMKVTVSLGGVVYDMSEHKTMLAKDMYQQVDEQMYLAKEGGRNQAHVLIGEVF